MTDSHSHLSLVPPATDNDLLAAPLAGRSDDELMLLARGGLPAAFDELVRRHQERVLRVAGRRLGRSALAADVAQNTFLEVYRALPRYRACGMFTSFLYRVLLNQCRMARRSGRRQAEPPVEDRIDDRPSVEARILARERARDVEVAVGRLSDKLRDVVLLRYTGGLGYDEIAATLGIPAGTVKRRLFDAMDKLRRFLEET
jgi:RNA polymerase sigma-70 factor, ECF subfamily